MSNNQELSAVDFEKQWHGRIVRPRGNHYKIPIKNYVVTAALYKYEGDVTIFGIMAEDYVPGPDGNAHLFTIRIGSEEFDECMNDFEIVVGDKTDENSGS